MSISVTAAGSMGQGTVAGGKMFLRRGVISIPYFVHFGVDADITGSAGALREVTFWTRTAVVE